MEQNQPENLSAGAARTFDVLLDDPGDVPTVGIAESIAAFKKIPFQDAAHDARLAWGFIGKNLSEPDARNLATILEKKSLRSRVIVSGSIAPLPPIEIVKSLSFETAGLQLAPASGVAAMLTPEQLSVIAAAALPLRSVTREKVTEGGRTNAQLLLNAGLMMAGIPISVGKKKRVVEKTSVKEDLLFYVDLLVKSPARRFRIDAQQLNYGFLKERMLHNTLQNFKTLLMDLTRWAPRAACNKGARMFIKGMMLSQMGYESLAHLEQETLWLSAL
jgi:hypothetical protein